jgi:nucleotide-binding universal stress UspA family protein
MYDSNGGPLEVEKTLATLQESRFEPAAPEIVEDRPRRAELTRTRNRVPSRESHAKVDLVLPLRDSVEVGRALDQSIAIAKTFGARVVLVNVVRRTDVPNGYLAYARSEGIRDYYSSYFGSQEGAESAKLKRRVEEEGVECAVHSYVGSLAGALKAYHRDRRVQMLVLSLPRRSLGDALKGDGLSLGMLSKLSVPVLLVPVQ